MRGLHDDCWERAILGEGGNPGLAGRQPSLRGLTNHKSRSSCCTRGAAHRWALQCRGGCSYPGLSWHSGALSPQAGGGYYLAMPSRPQAGGRPFSCARRCKAEAAEHSILVIFPDSGLPPPNSRGQWLRVLRPGPHCMSMSSPSACSWSRVRSESEKLRGGMDKSAPPPPAWPVWPRMDRGF